MRRNTLLPLVGAIAALAVACRDATVAPARSASSLSASASPSYSASGANGQRTLLGTLELSPNGGTYHVGDFNIIVPAGAVCDPSSTKYGPRYWDADCTPATSSVTVNVTAKKRGGRISIDFQPDLRFRPSAGWVVIQSSAYSDLLTSNAVRQLSPSSSYFQNFAILYVPTGGAAQIDEMRTTGDGSMVTHIDLRSGLVWRRIKHFSGYLITAGYSCTSTTTTTSTCTVDDQGTGTTVGTSTSTFTVLTDLTASTVVVSPNDSTTTP